MPGLRARLPTRLFLRGARLSPALTSEGLPALLGRIIARVLRLTREGHLSGTPPRARAGRTQGTPRLQFESRESSILRAATLAPASGGVRSAGRGARASSARSCSWSGSVARACQCRDAPPEFGGELPRPNRSAVAPANRRRDAGAAGLH